jgi:hypothetical protein
MTDQSNTEQNSTGQNSAGENSIGENSTGPEGVDPEFAPDGLGTGGFGDEGVGTDLPSDGVPGVTANDSATATPGGTRSGAESDPERKLANGGEDPGAGRQGPMVDDASIDWSELDGGAAPAGIPTDPQPTDGDAPAP